VPLGQKGNNADKALSVQPHYLWCESFEVMPRGGSIVASPKLKGIDGLAPQAVDFAVQLDNAQKLTWTEHIGARRIDDPS